MEMNESPEATYKGVEVQGGFSLREPLIKRRTTPDTAVVFCSALRFFAFLPFLLRTRNLCSCKSATPLFFLRCAGRAAAEARHQPGIPGLSSRSIRSLAPWKQSTAQAI